jgi:hypothetical protein
MEDDEKNYSTDMENAKWRFTTHGLSAAEKSYQYGILVLKNAFLVAGGGLFFIPTMAGLSAELDLEYAFIAGIFFGIAVLIALIANYAIHLNWMKLERLWEVIYEMEKIDIRAAYQRPFRNDTDDRAELEQEQSTGSKWVTYTFWIPHISIVLYLGSIIFGAANLYWAFGISFSEGT